MKNLSNFASALMLYSLLCFLLTHNVWFLPLVYGFQIAAVVSIRRTENRFGKIQHFS